MFPTRSLQIQSFGNHAEGLDGAISGEIVSTTPRQRLCLAIKLSGLLQDRTKGLIIDGLRGLRGAGRLSLRSCVRDYWSRSRVAGVFCFYRSEPLHAGNLRGGRLCYWPVDAGLVLRDGANLVAC